MLHNVPLFFWNVMRSFGWAVWRTWAGFIMIWPLWELICCRWVDTNQVIFEPLWLDANLPEHKQQIQCEVLPKFGACWWGRPAILQATRNHHVSSRIKREQYIWKAAFGTKILVIWEDNLIRPGGYLRYILKRSSQRSTFSSRPDIFLLFPWRNMLYICWENLATYFGLQEVHSCS